MEYYKFAQNNDVYKKYKEINNSVNNELESVYAIVRPLGAVGLYRTSTQVLGAVFPKELTQGGIMEGWDLAREDDNHSVLIPNNDNKNHQEIQIELQNTNELIKEKVFGCGSADYFAFVMTDKWLVVETTGVLVDFKANKCPRAFFKKICDKYKKEKNKVVFN